MEEERILRGKTFIDTEDHQYIADNAMDFKRESSFWSHPKKKGEMGGGTKAPSSTPFSSRGRWALNTKSPLTTFTFGVGEQKNRGKRMKKRDLASV